MNPLHMITPSNSAYGCSAYLNQLNFPIRAKFTFPKSYTPITEHSQEVAICVLFSMNAFYNALIQLFKTSSLPNPTLCYQLNYGIGIFQVFKTNTNHLMLNLSVPANYQWIVWLTEFFNCYESLFATINPLYLEKLKSQIHLLPDGLKQNYNEALEMIITKKEVLPKWKHFFCTRLKFEDSSNPISDSSLSQVKAHIWTKAASNALEKCREQFSPADQTLFDEKKGLFSFFDETQTGPNLAFYCMIKLKLYFEPQIYKAVFDEIVLRLEEHLIQLSANYIKQSKSCEWWTSGNGGSFTKDLNSMYVDLVQLKQQTTASRACKTIHCSEPKCFQSFNDSILKSYHDLDHAAEQLAKRQKIE